MLKSKVIEEKLAKLVGFLKELEGIRPISFDGYKSDPAIKRSCERLIQLIVESAADINSAVITGLGHLPPKDYYDTFIRAGEVKLINKGLAAKIAPWAGLRNRLVHEYENIKDRLVFEKIGPTLFNFREYIQQVEKFLKKY